MTFRAKPVVKRAHRPAWEGHDRRNFYLNIGFGLIVAIAVVILAAAAALSWYNDHLAPVGSVAGQNITKDDLRDRLAIESWRINQAEQRIRTAVVAGHLSEEEGASQAQLLEQQRQSLPTIALERLIDSRLQASLAPELGVTVSEVDIDARMTKEATAPELRHAWVIAATPTTDPGALSPTDAQKAAARSRLETALADIAGGKAWEDVARMVSTDAATAGQGGDMGWIQAEDATTDEAFLNALFAAPVGTPTAIVEDADGTFRIGRVTETAAGTVDPDFMAKLENDHIDLAKYRAVLAGDVMREKLTDAVAADLTGPGPQRHVSEIFISQTGTDPVADAIKVRHILYAPKDDPTGALDLDPADPAWAQAEAQAKVTYDKLKSNIGLFDSIARTESDEAQAQGPTGSGGKLPWFDKDSQIDAAFKAAIFGPDAKPGVLLAPVKSEFGWHVIQVQYGPTDDARLKALKAQIDAGADFAALARDNSEGATASVGGDLGWLARGQLESVMSDVVFGTKVGGTSDVVAKATDGLYLFRVDAEEERTPTARQVESIKRIAFDDWYEAKKATTTITRDPAITGS